MARGSIFPHHCRDGTTTWKIVYRTGDGTQVKRTCRSQREAERELAKVIGAVDRGELRTTSRETFAAVAARWLDHKRRRIEHSTFVDYEAHLRRRLVPAFGGLRLKDVTRERIEDYLARLDAEDKLSRKTINDSLIPLRQILARAVRDGHIPSNPAASDDRDDPLELPYERPPMHYLNREDAQRYLNHAPGWYTPIAEVLIGAGLRLGEALALERRDIDYETPALRVERSIKRMGVVGGTKGDRPRTVLIDPYLAGVLRDHIAASGRLNPLVFPSRAGTPFEPPNVRRRGHAPTLKAAGLNPRLRLHDLRHTAATLWLASGASIFFVKEQLGHADIQTTIDLYGHPDQQAHAEAAARAAAWWRGAEQGSVVTAVVTPGSPRASIPSRSSTGSAC